MFNPSRDQARSFLIESWAKRRESRPATPMETLAADLIAQHPEYHALLQAEDALQREWTPEQGQMNPFLHLSLHLAIEEQLSIDQPPGIRAIFGALLERHGERHAAQHVILDCLGETLWQAQQDRMVPNGEGYLDRLQRALK